MTLKEAKKYRELGKKYSDLKVPVTAIKRILNSFEFTTKKGVVEKRNINDIESVIAWKYSDYEKSFYKLRLLSTRDEDTKRRFTIIIGDDRIKNIMKHNVLKLLKPEFKDVIKDVKLVCDDLGKDDFLDFFIEIEFKEGDVR